MTFNEWWETRELVVNPDFFYEDGIFFVFDNSWYIEVTPKGLFRVPIGNTEVVKETLNSAARFLYWEMEAEITG